MTGWLSSLARVLDALASVGDHRPIEATSEKPEEDPRLDLLKSSLDACRDYYKDLSTQWSSLDTKAQGAGTVAGIFLAGIFAFVRDISVGSPYLERLAISVAVALLVASIVCAIWAVMVREADEVSSHQFSEAVEELYALEDGASDERIRDFYRDQIGVWEEAVTDVKRVVDKKALLLKVAQGLLLVAVTGAAIVTVVRIWG